MIKFAQATIHQKKRPHHKPNVTTLLKIAFSNFIHFAKETKPIFKPL